MRGDRIGTTPTTELAEKLEAIPTADMTLEDQKVFALGIDTLRKQAEELERCRTALSEPVTDAEWSTAYLDMVGMTMSEEDAVETRPNQRGAMVTQILMRRRLARSAYNEPKQNGEAKWGKRWKLCWLGLKLRRGRIKN